jgi:hypothetical protein
MQKITPKLKSMQCETQLMVEAILSFQRFRILELGAWAYLFNCRVCNTGPTGPDSYIVLLYVSATGECLCGCFVVSMSDTNFFLVLLWEEKLMTSQYSDDKNKSRTFKHNFNKQWESKYFFVIVNNKDVFYYAIPS